MTKSPISVAIFGGASVVCMGVALVRCRTAFLLTLSFWGQFLVRALESVEVEKGRRKGRWYFFTFRFGPIKNANDNFVPFQVFFRF